MVYCKHCETSFSEDRVIKTKNYVPYGSTQVYESTSEECPHCHSNNLEFDADVVECDCCGKEILESCAEYDAEKDIYLCKDCDMTNR